MTDQQNNDGKKPNRGVRYWNLTDGIHVTINNKRQISFTEKIQAYERMIAQMRARVKDEEEDDAQTDEDATDDSQK